MKEENGSYSLLVKVSENKIIEVGSKGEVEFRKGFYVYNGSAFGSGGLKRVERHERKSENGDGCHWHIDYLLTCSSSEIVRSFTEKGSDHECSLSQEMKKFFDFVEGFGCTDCSCGSHLFYSSSKDELTDFLKDFYSC